MGDVSEAAAVRRALDRLGFGAGGETLAKAQSAGLAATIDSLLPPATLAARGGDPGATKTPPPNLPPVMRPRGMGRPRGAEPGTERVKPSKADKKEWRQSRREQHQQLSLWWLDRMVMAEQQATERLTWFWHGHFATSNQKVKNAQLMLAQNETMRRLGLGDFRQLAQAMIIDPAMLIWLDGNNNTAKAPNENLSREFLELFSLGHGNYSEHDVREAARALTGWKINRSRGTAMLRPGQHDSGVKDILGSTGAFEAKSFVTLVVGQQSSARFVASRLWFRLVSTTPPSPAALARLTAAYGPGRNMTSLLRAITREPAFIDTATSIVKQPVEWTVGLMRALKVRPTLLEPQQQRRLTVTLRGMGQLPFLPPSVGGWPAGGGWLTTAGALSRMEAARLITSVAELGKVTQRSAPQARVDYIRRLLGVDAFSPRTVNAISQVASDFPAAVAVAASSPEYTVSR